MWTQIQMQFEGIIPVCEGHYKVLWLCIHGVRNSDGDPLQYHHTNNLSDNCNQFPCYGVPIWYHQYMCDL